MAKQKQLSYENVKILADAYTNAVEESFDSVQSLANIYEVEIDGELYIKKDAFVKDLNKLSMVIMKLVKIKEEE